MATCGHCGTPGQPDAAKFCAECGAAMTAPRCGSCGSEMLPGAKFCGECGTPQLSASEAPAARPASARRLATVLFGDLVGFTALSEHRDPEEVRELLSRYFDECRTIIARYGGTVEKFIGDAVMAVWGVPTAHEDNAERAVRAGLELVVAVAAIGADVGVTGLALRVGVVTGEVAVTVGATQQGMVAGDPVNTAARVQSAASAGQVWVDETTRLLTTAAISYTDVGAHAMKGKVDPVPLWAAQAVLAGVGGGQRVDGLEAPHVGRDRELRVVKELFHTVEEAARPALVVVSGDPGVGKTRLGWEFQKYVDGLSTSLRWHTGRCLSYGEGVAFYALAEAVRGRLQALAPDDASDGTAPGDASDADLAQQLALSLDLLVRDADERSWLEPRLAALLGIGGVASHGREDLFHAWTTFLERVSQLEGPWPVVLVIEDAHHADDGLVAFLEHLLTAATFGVYVVLLTRPELVESHPALVTHRRATVVHLEPVSEPQMRELIGGLVADLPAAACEELVQRADGVPLYAVETVRSLIDRDLVVPRGGRYVLADGADVDLASVTAPASLQALLTARLDALPSDQRRLVEIASVIGESFHREELTALGVADAEVEEALGHLTRAQVLRRESDRLSAQHGQYQFVQSALRHTALGTLSRRERKRLHLAIADLTASGDGEAGEAAAVVAEHLLRALEAVPDAADVASLSERAVEQLRRAATRASSLGAPAEAAGHLESALEWTSEPEARARIELDLAHALRACRRFVQAVEHADSALAHYDAAGEVLAAARAAAIGAVARCDQGEIEVALRITTERAKTIAGLPGSAETELELNTVAITSLLRGGAGDMGPLAERSVQLAELGGDPGAIASGYLSLALHYQSVGAPQLSQMLLERSAEMFEEVHDGLGVARCLVNLTAASNPQDAERSTGLGERAMRAARSSGHQLWVDYAQMNYVGGLLFHGSWESAWELADAPEMSPDDRVYLDLTKLEIAAARGEAWDPPTPPSVDAENVVTRSLGGAVAAHLAARAGESATEALVASAQTYYDYTGLVDDFTYLFRSLVETAFGAGDPEAVRRLLGLLDEHPGELRMMGLRTVEALARGRLAVLEGTDPEAFLVEAIRCAQAWRAAPALAQARAAYGAWLTREGRHDEAVEPLALARATFDALGATAWSVALERTHV